MRRFIAALQSPVVEGLLLVVSLCRLPIQQLRSLTVITDPDIWWHIRVGQWIIEHHAVPRQGLYSLVGSARPWCAYSWGFETVIAAMHLWLGLKGIPLFVMAFHVALFLILFTLLHRLSRSFWRAWFLTALVIWGMDPNWVGAGRPVMFSVLFFTVELALIFKAQETGKPKYIYWLPLLFLLWANFHIQFLYGLVLPALLATVATVEGWTARKWPSLGPSASDTEPLRPAILWGVFATSAAATLLNPYGINLYAVIYNYAHNTFAYSIVGEFQALSFRQSSNYAELLLTLAAFFALGRRKTDTFKLAVLLLAALVSFRMLRDSWFLCITAAAVLAGVLRKPEKAPETAGEPAPGLRALHLSGVLAGVASVSALSALDAGLSNRVLQQMVNKSFPMEAVLYIREHRPPGPIYNNFNWGGFLIGALPEYPVSIDGRTDLYGDELLRQAIDAQLGLKWADDPALTRANLVLLPSSMPLCRVLERLPAFQLVHSDPLAMVFVRRPQGSGF